jgi:hypothetical protein
MKTAELLDKRQARESKIQDATSVSVWKILK